MGDMILNSSTSAQKVKERLTKIKKDKNNDMMENISIEDLFGLKVNIPEPVFFCSIEPYSNAYQNALERALIELQREDPSFTVSHNQETGQTVLGGMGELHLEIIKDRILQDYKVKAELGALQINYHEAIIKKVTEILNVSTKIGNSDQALTIKLSTIPVNQKNIKDFLIFDKTPEASKNISAIYHKHLLAIRQGIEVGLTYGPKLNCKVSNAQIMLHYFSVQKGTSESMISAATTQLVQKLIKLSGTNLLEPTMNLEIVTPEEYLSPILADLSRKRTVIKEIFIRGNMKVLRATTPLSELMGYSTILRTLSSGTSTFTMEFCDYKEMSSYEEEKAIKNIRGF